MNDSGSFLNKVPGAGGGNNRTLLYVIIGVAVACVLCVAGIGILGLIGIKVLPSLTQNVQPTAVVQEQQQQPRNTGPIQGITLAKGVTGDEMTPVDATTVFAPTDTIHAVVQIVDAPTGTKFKAVWLVTDVGDAAAPNTQIAEYELTAEGSRNLDFTLAPNNQWPAGTYRAEIYVNGNLTQTAKFSVQ